MAQGRFDRWLERAADRLAGEGNDEPFQETLDGKIRNYGVDSDEACQARNYCARRFNRQGRWDECRLLREANVEACLRRDGPNARSTLAAQNYLALSLWMTGRPEEACELLRHVVRIGEQVLRAKDKLLKDSGVVGEDGRAEALTPRPLPHIAGIVPTTGPGGSSPGRHDVL